MYSQAWGFDVAAINATVQLWHGGGRSAGAGRARAAAGRARYRAAGCSLTPTRATTSSARASGGSWRRLSIPAVRPRGRPRRLRAQRWSLATSRRPRRLRPRRGAPPAAGARPAERPAHRRPACRLPGSRKAAGSGPLQAAVALEPAGDRLQHRVRHRAEVAQRLVRVLADVEVDLGDRVEPDLRVGVEQQRDVDAVSGGERQPLEQLTAGGDLAGQRLTDRCQLRIEEVEQRPCRQLGDAAAAVRQGRPRRPGTAGGRSP